MNFDKYQEACRETAQYPNRGNNYVYPVLGICGESGEVAEKIKKIIRDKNGIINEQDRKEICKELGDVMWYISATCDEVGLKLDIVARTNINKLKDRKNRNKIHGSGDNR